MKCLWTAALCVISASTFADITYTVDVQPDKGNLHVTIRVSDSTYGTRFQMPNWGPGGYVIRDGARGVKNLKATDGNGKDLAIDTSVVVEHKQYQDGDQKKVADNPVTTWTVAPAKNTVVEYDLATTLNDGSVHWSGPSTDMYVLDHRLDKCVLDANVPAGWHVYTGLDEVSAKDSQIYQRGKLGVGTGSLDPGQNLVYTAPTYDVLADNPVTAGDDKSLIVDTYKTLGKTHYIVMRGAPRTKVDRAKLLKACKFVSDSENDFFGNKPPYDHYVWHFAVTDAEDGAGGLEHLASTEITLARGVGPRCVDVLAHEFFHLWNVKRIRSFPLGPFDYTKLPETGAIWWLEGVTDYYAYTLLHRYGWTDDASYLKSAASNLQTVLRNPAHTEISPNESSLRVAEAANGHGNSNGYRISYYNLGWIAGMCLDINLRSRTHGKHTLDDVEHALWNLCKNDQPGFQEDEMRKQYVAFGGDPAVYDAIVMQPNMPVDQALALAGLEAKTTDESYVNLGFTWGGGPGSTALTVSSATGPAEGKLQFGDVILAVDGKPVEGATGRERQASMAALTKGAMAGKPIAIHFKRGDGEMTVDVTPVTATRPVYTIQPMANQTAEQKKVAEGWLLQKKAK